MSDMNLVHSLPFHESLSGWVIGSNPDHPSDASDWTQGPVQVSLLSQPESRSFDFLKREGKKMRFYLR